MSSIHSKFPMGHIVSTPGAIEACFAQGVSQVSLLQRHGQCDWGDLYPEDKARNDRAFLNGDERIFSSYKLPIDGHVWIITEADRNSTTLLLPNEY